MFGRRRRIRAGYGESADLIFCLDQAAGVMMGGKMTQQPTFLHAAAFGAFAALLFMISVKAIERYDF